MYWKNHRLHCSEDKCIVQLFWNFFIFYKPQLCLWWRLGFTSSCFHEKKKKNKKKTYFNGKDAESLFCHLLLTTRHARVPCAYSGLSYDVCLYLVSSSTNVLHSNSPAIRNFVPFCKSRTYTKCINGHSRQLIVLTSTLLPVCTLYFL